MAENQSRSASTITDLEFRALALLRCIVAYFHKHNKAPGQVQLVTKTAKGKWGGLLNEWIDESGARAEYPFGFSGGPRVHDAATILSEAGLIVPRGYMSKQIKDGTEEEMRNRRNSYTPTPAGVSLGNKLIYTHWKLWEGRWLKGE